MRLFVLCRILIDLVIDISTNLIHNQSNDKSRRNIMKRKYLALTAIMLSCTIIGALSSCNINNIDESEFTLEKSTVLQI